MGLSFVRVLVVDPDLNVVLSRYSGLEDADEFVEATVHHVEPFAFLRFVNASTEDGVRKLLTKRVDCVGKGFGCQEVLRLDTKFYQHSLVIGEFVRQVCSPCVCVKR